MIDWSELKMAAVIVLISIAHSSIDMLRRCLNFFLVTSGLTVEPRYCSVLVDGFKY